MRLGRVIGRVTLSVTLPQLEGGRWLLVSPLGREQFKQELNAPTTITKDPSLVVYDNLGAGNHDTIGFVEGREAAQPFDVSPPIDAINAALIDTIFYQPKP